MSERVLEQRTSDDIEHKIKAVDVVLRLLRAQRAADQTLEGKLSVEKPVRHIEAMRANLRRELFDAIDAEEKAVTA